MVKIIITRFSQLIVHAVLTGMEERKGGVDNNRRRQGNPDITEMVITTNQKQDQK